MKKLNLLFIAFALVLTGCSSDDDGNAPDITPDTTDDLVGTWIANDLSIISDVTFTLVGQP
ncbi:MAG: starvation-inducible outer membrane lipoprotein, partial [Psychroserpens sp.]